MRKQKEDFIPKVKRIPRKIKETEPEAVSLPKDLEDLWAAVIAISTCHKVLQEGMFPFRFNNAIGVSLKFLEELHTKAVTDASAHPNWDLIPELKELVEKRAQDGKATKDQ